MHRGQEALDDAALTAVVARVRASAARATGAALDALADEVGEIRSLALRRTRADFPTDVATMRRAPFESRADPVMYRSVLAEAARSRGSAVTEYDARDVAGQAAELLSMSGPEAIAAMRTLVGPPWSADHRLAYAAAVVAARPAVRGGA